MAKLIYTALMSLDGYIEDADGSFDWAAPDEEVHAFVNDLERSVGTYLLGRRMYETMAVWDSPHTLPDPTPAMLDYARIWQRIDKVVYTTTLAEVPGAKTRIERGFDLGAVRRMKQEAQTDMSIGGPNLAAAAFAAGLVDELRLFVVPIVVGGGKAALPSRVELELQDERRFEGGTIHLCYSTRN